MEQSGTGMSFRFCLFNGHQRDAVEFWLEEAAGGDELTVEDLQRQVSSLAQISTENLILLFCLRQAFHMLFESDADLLQALSLPKPKDHLLGKPLFVNLSSHTRRRRLKLVGCVGDEEGVGIGARSGKGLVLDRLEGSMVEHVAALGSRVNVLFVFDRSVIFKPFPSTLAMQSLVVRAKQENDYQEVFECMKQNIENLRVNTYHVLCQWKTIQAVKLNLNHYLEQLLSITNDFATKYAAFHSDVSSKLQGLEAEVSKLNQVKIPASVNSRLKVDALSEVTLADVVKIDMSIQEELEKLDRSIKKKAQYLADRFSAIEDELVNSPVYSWVPPTLPEVSPSSERVREAADLLAGGSECHETLVRLSKEVESEVDEVVSDGRLLNEKFMQTLVLVSRVQSDIQQMINKAFTWKGIFSSGEALKEQVERIRQLPTTFAACLSEVVRRKSFSKLYAAEIQRLAEEVGSLREEEVKRREEFMRNHGQLLPGGIVPGIQEIQIPHIEIVRRQFDAQLPNVSLEEVHQVYISLDGSSQSPTTGQVSKELPEQKGAVLLEPAEALIESNSKQLKGEIERLQSENDSLKAELLMLKQQFKSQSDE